MLKARPGTSTSCFISPRVKTNGLLFVWQDSPLAMSCIFETPCGVTRLYAPPPESHVLSMAAPRLDHGGILSWPNKPNMGAQTLIFTRPK
jgi:hypothetical protein